MMAAAAESASGGSSGGGSGSSDTSSTGEEERMRRLFQTCDGDGDGYISRSPTGAVFRLQATELGKIITSAQMFIADQTLMVKRAVLIFYNMLLRKLDTER